MGSSPGPGHCVNGSLHPGLQMGTGELMLGVTLASYPGGVEILLVALCYRNRDELRPDGPLGSLNARIESPENWMPLGAHHLTPAETEDLTG